MKTSCSWCHALNSIASTYCESCGHRAHWARMDCDCPRCRPSLAAGDQLSLPLTGGREIQPRRNAQLD